MIKSRIPNIPPKGAAQPQEPRLLAIHKIMQERRPDARSVGRRIKAAREELGLSQYVLALQLGITPGAVGQWEIGGNLPHMDKWDTLSRALGKTPNWIFFGDDPPGAGDDPAEEVAERRILQVSRGIGKEGRLAMLMLGENWGEIKTGDSVGVTMLIEQWAAMPPEMRKAALELVHAMSDTGSSGVARLIKQWAGMSDQHREMILQVASAIPQTAPEQTSQTEKPDKQRVEAPNRPKARRGRHSMT